MVILGIDPGFSRVGYGVVDFCGKSTRIIDSGLMDDDRGAHFGDRLSGIYRRARGLVQKHKPERAAIEKVYFAKNSKTAMEVAQARGVIYAALSGFGVPVVEIAPTSVKLAITGSGRASKQAVAKMLFRIMGPGAKNSIDDVTDALAIAFAASGHFSR